MIPLLAATLAVALPAAPEVLVVDHAGGPGSDFANLHDALVAAAVGDTLFVRGGTYDTGPGQFAPTAFVVDRALSIVGEAGAAVTLIDAFRVSQLPPGETVHLQGLTFAPSSSADGQQQLMPFAHQADFRGGTVWAEDCAFVAPSGVLATGAPVGVLWPTVLVRNSRLVLVSCAVSGGATLAFGGPNIDPPLGAEGSEVFVYDSAVHSVATAEGNDGVLLRNSTLFASGSSFSGAAGLPPPGFELCGSDGFAAVHLESGAAEATFVDCSFQAGAAGESSPGCANLPSAGDAIAVDVGSAVLLPGVARTLSSASPATGGGASALIYAGGPADLVVVGVSPTSKPAVPLGLLGAPVFLSTEAFLFVAGVAGAGGGLTVGFLAPQPDPVAEALAFEAQAFGFDGSKWRASSPTHVTVLVPGL